MPAETSTAHVAVSPLHKRALRLLSEHGEMTARELGLDLNQREHVARDVVAQLQTRDLVVTRYNGHATLARLTDRGRDAVATMRAQHVARAERQSIISAADPASVVTCPTCRGARRFCETCLGLRVVIAEQQS